MKSIFLPFLLLLSSYTLMSQESFVSLGGDIYGNIANVSYSIGQLNYISSKTNSHLIVEGVQQLESHTTTTGITKYDNLQIDAWPNPTSNWVHLSINGKLPQKLDYVLINVKGQYLHAKKMNSSSVDIDMTTFTSGIYILPQNRNRKAKTSAIPLK
ncbi:MAG: T9SS type A sorting domain-containing protein [Chitinophagales bacterium]|nr:T9SS type A sorting domain-containing protein [Chitinophagales bacterium]